MLSSLFISNPGVSFRVYILTGDTPDQKNQENFNRLAFLYNQDIIFITVDESILCNCPIRLGDHVTLATYYRLLAPLVLPDYIEKVIYLDGDLIVDDSIMDLWNTDVSNVAFAAAIDESYNDPEIYRRLGLDINIPYTSAGVLLINLKYWRQQSVMERSLDCINKMKEKLLFHDQDAINVVLQNEKSFFPIRFNFQSGYIRPWAYNSYDIDMQNNIIQAIPHPVVIHYSGPGKPWFRFNDHPYKSYYFHYKSLSLWKDLRQINTYDAKAFAHDILGRILRLIHLKPKMYIISAQKKNGTFFQRKV